MVRVTQYSHIFVNAKKLPLTINTVDFQSNSYFFVKKNVNLQEHNIGSESIGHQKDKN